MNGIIFRPVKKVEYKTRSGEVHYMLVDDIESEIKATPEEVEAARKDLIKWMQSRKENE